MEEKRTLYKNEKDILRRKKVAAIALASILSTTTTGCDSNYTMIDTKLTYNKAIIFRENSVTIVEIESWKDYEGEQFQIKTKDGAYIVTSVYDTKLIDNRTSAIKAEDIAKSIMGEDVEIRYLNEVSHKTR